MKSGCIMIMLAVVSLSVTARDDPAQMKREIAQHRAIAAAHEAAARCKETGKKEDICHAELAKACQGLAIGKLCGMKHVHAE